MSDTTGTCPLCLKSWDRCCTRDVQHQVDLLWTWVEANRDDREGGDAIEQP